LSELSLIQLKQTKLDLSNLSSLSHFATLHVGFNLINHTLNQPLLKMSGNNANKFMTKEDAQRIQSAVVRLCVLFEHIHSAKNIC
jgi:hypothetical protein